MKNVIIFAIILMFSAGACSDNSTNLRQQRDEAMDRTDRVIELAEKAVVEAEYWQKRAEKCEAGKDEVSNSGRRLGKN